MPAQPPATKADSGSVGTVGASGTSVDASDRSMSPRLPLKWSVSPSDDTVTSPFGTTRRLRAPPMIDPAVPNPYRSQMRELLQRDGSRSLSPRSDRYKGKMVEAAGSVLSPRLRGDGSESPRSSVSFSYLGSMVGIWPPEHSDKPKAVGDSVSHAFPKILCPSFQSPISRCVFLGRRTGPSES